MYRVARRISNHEHQQHQPFFFDYGLRAEHNSRFGLYRRDSDTGNWQKLDEFDSVAQAQEAADKDHGRVISTKRWVYPIAKAVLHNAKAMGDATAVESVFREAEFALNVQTEVSIEEQPVNGRAVEVKRIGSVVELKDYREYYLSPEWKP